VHAHVQRLVSVVKMATVLEKCVSTTEQQGSIVFFGGGEQKLSMQRISIMKCFLFTVESDCHVNWFITS
jgi:hypothetical protein